MIEYTNSIRLLLLLVFISGGMLSCCYPEPKNNLGKGKGDAIINAIRNEDIRALDELHKDGWEPNKPLTDCLSGYLGDLPIEYAVCSGSLDSIRWLLRNGVKAATRTSCGEWVITLCPEEKKKEIQALLGRKDNGGSMVAYLEIAQHINWRSEYQVIFLDASGTPDPKAVLSALQSVRKNVYPKSKSVTAQDAETSVSNNDRNKGPLRLWVKVKVVPCGKSKYNVNITYCTHEGDVDLSGWGRTATVEDVCGYWVYTNMDFIVY